MTNSPPESIAGTVSIPDLDGIMPPIAFGFGGSTIGNSSNGTSDSPRLGISPSFSTTPEGLLTAPIGIEAFGLVAEKRPASGMILVTTGAPDALIPPMLSI